MSHLSSPATEFRDCRRGCAQEICFPDNQKAFDSLAGLSCFLFLLFGLFFNALAFADSEQNGSVTSFDQDSPLFQSPVVSDSSSIFWQVAERLNEQKIIFAEFNQEKRIAVLLKPLLSSGKLFFSVDDGLCIETEKPFYNLLSITPTAVFQKDQDLEKTSVLPEGEALASNLSSIFLAVFSGDHALLESNFHLFAAGDPDNWKIGLKPRDRLVRSFLQSIVLTGNSSITAVEFLEENGDLTVISLSPEAPQKQVIAEQKKKCFE